MNRKVSTRIVYAILLCNFFACHSAWAGSPHPSLPIAGTTDGVGVNIHFTDPLPGEMKMLAEAGFRFIRMDFGWAATEREKGQYNFSAYDRLLAALEAHQVKAVWILDYSNPLYEQERSVATEQGRQAYARWAAAAVDHFRDRGVVWEIWNEPNISGFWKPEPNIDEYTAMALAACQAIRKVAPEEAIVGPATSTMDFDFLEGCFKAGLLQYFDAVSVHPYRQSTPETVASEYYRLQHLIGQYAPANRTIPILSAEWGYSSVWGGFDDVRQSKMLARELLINIASHIPLSIWYDWHDDGLDPKEPEHHFGTVENKQYAGRDPVYDPKPSYLAATALTQHLAGLPFQKRIALDHPDDYAMLFSKDGQRTLAVWTTAANEHRLRIPSDEGTWTASDYLGKPLEQIVVVDDALRVAVSDAPTYLTFGGDNRRLDSAAAVHLLKATLEFVTNDQVTVSIDNLSERPFVGRLSLLEAGQSNPSSKKRVELDANEGGQRIPFALQNRDEPEVGFVIEDENGGVMFRQTPRRFAPQGDELLQACRIATDGDASVESTQSSSFATAPDCLPGTTQNKAFKIDFQFGDGWKFVQWMPKSAATIPGKPTGFGFWIYGDGSGVSPRLRIRDATGQTWQPSGEAISWKGWRFIEIALEPSTAHWGGSGDGVIHYPLTWESVLLIDNISRQKIKGAIYVTSPLVIYEAGAAQKE